MGKNTEKHEKWEMYILGPELWLENGKSGKWDTNTIWPGNSEKWEMHTVGSGIWQETVKNVENEKYTL